MTEFSGRLPKQAWMSAPETVKVMEALHLDGGEARFVGGCVRDALANRKVIDIDIATPLKPEEVIERLKKSRIRFVPTGLKHGTVTAVVDGKPFEITTLRIDVVNHGRYADVAFTADWKADAARRDFTINALSATTDGDIYDPFGGIRDLRLGRVVFVGEPEKRIAEDHLRILRFFRFAAHFGATGFDGKLKPLDASALRACAKDAALLQTLSAERVRQEVLKLLESPRCADVWRVMLECGVVTQILPEATAVDTLERLVALEEKYADSGSTGKHGGAPLRRLAALLEITREGLKSVIAALRLSNAQAAQLDLMALPLDGVSAAMDGAAARKLVYRQGGAAALSLFLLAAARDGAEANLPLLHAVATSFSPPSFPLQGEDVMKLGYAPGPGIGRILRELEDWWLEQDFGPGRDECLARLAARYGRK